MGKKMKRPKRKPTKLTIRAYSDREMKTLSGELSAMYNPDSVSLDYSTAYMPDQFVNTSRQSNRYVQTQPGNLTLELLFDARMPGNRRPIDLQLGRLRALCYDVNPARGEPRYLQILWGQMRWNGRGYFSGRMLSLSFRYTLFEPDATPLRATAQLVLAADESLIVQAAQEQLQSPASVVVQVPDATSLPHITSNTVPEIAGKADYLQVAADNKLDCLDAIKPGQALQISAHSGGPL
jgi:Contractile injection system tube protein